MSLRVRMGVAAGVAVAVAVIAVAFSAYAGTRSQLIRGINDQLDSLIKPLGPPGANGGFGGPGAPNEDFGGNVSGGNVSGGNGSGGNGGVFRAFTDSNDCDDGYGIDRTRGGAFGGAQGYVQLVDPGGSVCLATGETIKLPVDGTVRTLATRGSGTSFTDATVHDIHLRVLTHGVGRYGALEVALPLKQVDDALSRQLLLLAIVAAAGVALAALLGILVARTALAPIARFTRQTEEIAAQPDRIGDQRLEVRGADELARLAQTFNRTLDALERSVQAQRNLVADASHELRTPISTIRANLQLMRDEEMLSPQDREALRTDVIDELDELTALVGDVVELARGTKQDGEPGDVRLDAVVADAVERTRRRAPELTVTPSIEPTLVYGEGDRVARAVNNLLDNAVKYGHGGGVIEVDLHDGTLTVRDHGPGFHDEDLPFVFDRFHRAADARGKSGSGLGLAIVRQAAEAHGGTVHAANAEGGGARMTVSFGPAQPIAQLAERDRVSPS